MLENILERILCCCCCRGCKGPRLPTGKNADETVLVGDESVHASEPVQVYILLGA